MDQPRKVAKHACGQLNREMKCPNREMKCPCTYICGKYRYHILLFAFVQIPGKKKNWVHVHSSYAVRCCILVWSMVTC